MATSPNPFSIARACAVAIILAVSSVAAAVADVVFGTARWCRTTFERIVLSAPKAIEAGVVQPSRPAVLLVQARTFVSRLLKRDRPVLTASWRVCPSI